MLRRGSRNYSFEATVHYLLKAGDFSGCFVKNLKPGIKLF
jgi:hypothetical protein